MKLKAQVKNITNNATHFVGDLSSTGTTIIPPPVRISIEGEGSSFYLFRYDEGGKCTADTWHKSVEDAQRQANFEYGTCDSDWEETA